MDWYGGIAGDGAPFRQRVAVVGSGLAGLTTAYLLEQGGRFDVSILESGPTAALDGASITTPQGGRIDVPMRSFAPGYYSSLLALCHHLGVSCRQSLFVFRFFAFDCSADPCLTFPSAVHRIPPRPAGVSFVGHWLHVVWLLFWYAYFTLCTFFVSAAVEEDFGTYLARVKVSPAWVEGYLLPLLSAVATCTHDQVLLFPASDIVTYKRQTHGQPHLVVDRGMGAVQDMLLRGMDIRYGCTVTSVETAGGAVLVCWEADDGPGEELFDMVVLAVAPDVVGRIFPRLAGSMARIPTATVDVAVHLSAPHASSPLADTIDLVSRDGRTEATHHHRCGVAATTSPLQPVHPAATSSFTRVLRSVESQRIVQSLFDAPRAREKPWASGNEGVYLVGGWCWDGLVLLEGCVRSAERVAAELEVRIPWREKQTDMV